MPLPDQQLQATASAPEKPSYRNLPPVEENVERPEALSQTFLNHTDRCARAGYLYIATRDEQATSHAMDRGTAGHEFAARFIELLIDNDENTAPPEVAKDVLASVYVDHPELQLPAHERETLRIIAHHFAENLWIEPENVVAIEKMLELQIGNVRVRGKVDFAAIYPSAHHALIRDWKMSFAPPTTEDEDFEHLFQTLLYALMLLEGKGEDDPVPIGRDLETVTVEEVYCRNKGMPAPRKATLSRQQLLDFKDDLMATIAMAERGFATGKWQAVPGSHCSKCPARHLCPLPPELIPAADPEDAEGLAEKWYWHQQEGTRLKKILRGIAEQNGPIPIGADLELSFTFSKPSRAKKDKVSWEEIEGAIEQGGFNPKDYIEATSPSARFDKRKVKA
jgi:hypothetical protein